jgi:HEPN domain-containing protein
VGGCSLPPSLELIRGWLTKAERDLLTGRRALDGDPPIADTAAFHAQQAVEKALKALLVFCDIEPPRTHVIALLLGRCAGIIPELDRIGPSCSWLTAFAVEKRYPDSDTEPTAAEARESLGLAARVLTIIRDYLPEEAKNGD